MRLAVVAAARRRMLVVGVGCGRGRRGGGGEGGLALGQGSLAPESEGVCAMNVIENEESEPTSSD